MYNNSMYYVGAAFEDSKASSASSSRVTFLYFLGRRCPGVEDIDEYLGLNLR